MADRGPATEQRHGPLLLKLLVTVGLYAIIFYRVDLGELAARLASVRVGFVAIAITVYGTGQVASAYRWYLLLEPVRLTSPFGRVLGFYFIGMFFNMFLPTIVGGDAVKAVLLARDTQAPARATISVFMERNVGLLALLIIASVAVWLAPPIDLAGVGLPVIVLGLFGAFVVVNALLFSRRAHALLDRLIAFTPLARVWPKAQVLYDAVSPYRRAPRAMLPALGLAFLFQIVVIVVVFLNARALGQVYPLAAIAVFVPLISLAGMLPISVNGLGVRDACYLLLFGQLGASAEMSVSLALLHVAVTLFASLPGGLVYAVQKRPAFSRHPVAIGDRQEPQP